MFDPMGLGEAVEPAFLRWNCPVVDRKLSRKELRLLIKDIFNERLLSVASDGSAAGCTLASFVNTYLEARFGDEVYIPVRDP